MSLGLWGRVVVVAIGSGVVLLAVIIVTCFVHPCCWGYRYLEKVSNRKKNGLREVIVLANGVGKKPGTPKVEQYQWLSKNDYIIYQSGRNGLVEKKIDEAYIYQTSEREINLKCAPFMVNPAVGETDNSTGASLRVKLSYRPLDGDTTMGRLTVHLLEANSLPYREYFTSLEPYAVLDVLNSKWSLNKTERIVQTVQSRVIRHTFNPKFDQIFPFDAKKSEMKDWCLKFTIMDKDRMTRHTPICEKRIYVRDVRNLTTEPEVEIVTCLQEINRNQGELLFGISYLPTAQRLSISIMKASSLKYFNVVQSLNEFYPYVRVLMLNSQGKCMKKKKTSFKVAEENPVFNETLAFDLQVSNLEHAVFLLVLCSKILVGSIRLLVLFWQLGSQNGKRSSSDGSITDAETTDHHTKENRDNVLGAIVIGRNVKCSKARDHWLMVMQNPRKVISVWHKFR